MEEITSSASSSSLVLLPKETSLNLQQYFHCLLQIRPEDWVYSIFWQPSRDDRGRLVLTWGDGQFRGMKDLSPNNSTNQRVFKELGTPTSTDFNLSSNMDTMLVQNEVSNLERYFIVSITKSYSSEESILGRALCSGTYIWLCGEDELGTYECERVREARMTGIKSIVCISTPYDAGVLELGSTKRLQEDWTLVHLAKSLFTSYFLRTDIAPHVHKEHQCNVVLKEEVTKMDKASLLSDAVGYIKELRSRIDELEGELKFLPQKLGLSKVASLFGGKTEMMSQVSKSRLSPSLNFVNGLSKMEVKVVGDEAVVRVQSSNRDHPAARLMGALKELELEIHHASMSSVKGMMLQDVVIRTPIGWASEESLRDAILASLCKV
ncbi:hypothetical protein BT93_C1594 [Corymbia citriodora subsp. variegata]|nr:hypothetical protein BT93_C1594 [Corymbia citriodora subsp. variegata]